MRKITTAPLQFLKRSTSDETGILGSFSGLASTFSARPDRQGDIILPGAFQKSLAELNSNGGKLPLLWQHDPAEPIGAITSAQETPEGLVVEGSIALDNEAGRKAYALLKTGGLSMSIGFFVPPGGAETKNGINYIREIELAEISLVPVAANPGAVVRSVKYASEREFETALHTDMRLSCRAAKKVAQLAWPALADDDEQQKVARFVARLDSVTTFLRD